ncbi:MAG: helix-turn-helix transcriptional regulator [Pedobacter sp.]|uniref:helix-turn-helix domain-containing protein n=1 Tax=Pedobacter sp. TaxID=1411316 RepID=UPI003568FE49
MAEERTRLLNNIHQGRNVKRFREMLGMKQEALAIQLGEDWHQKRISILETREEIEPEVLVRVAIALNVSEDAIKNFDEDTVVNYLNSYTSGISQKPQTINSNLHQDCNFNPLDKLIQVLEENKMLYERLLVCEQEKIEILKNSISHLL